jgi:hypothetical protein
MERSANTPGSTVGGRGADDDGVVLGEVLGEAGTGAGAVVAATGEVGEITASVVEDEERIGAADDADVVAAHPASSTRPTSCSDVELMALPHRARYRR